MVEANEKRPLEQILHKDVLPNFPEISECYIGVRYGALPPEKLGKVISGFTRDKVTGHLTQSAQIVISNVCRNFSEKGKAAIIAHEVAHAYYDFKNKHVTEYRVLRMVFDRGFSDHFRALFMDLCPAPCGNGKRGRKKVGGIDCLHYGMCPHGIRLQLTPLL